MGAHTTPDLTTDQTIPRRNYFIFGDNISQSLSPTLHNAGFRALGLPYHYSIHQTPSVDSTVAEIVKQPDFGGASVTFPHKLHIAPLLDAITPCAAEIGAINTIVAQGEGGHRRLLGDNTDWIGIKNCIERSKPKNLESCAALVLGAGGAARAACYAFQVLGVGKLIVVNRTVSKGEEMASHFPTIPSQVFATFDEALAGNSMPIRIIVACVPAENMEEHQIPKELFSSGSSETSSGGGDGSVLVEMAYKPQVTAMMKVATSCSGWNICRGIDVLEEQAYGQFEMWTGREAPATVMREAMREKAKANM
ncbi:hypothetical protein N0V83_004360 [Neocucurbitaria cava]|uniref:Shikimate dehydrogenase substrate binding N-terminal domain-containing protein n=1 Tax=Neocucurbitaria cava TaxID=798079 RepID=A0A9W9CM41_9PLEO|nr:hypothetical protein N0V83_004360 [Neocucurbitaria cava]